MTKQETAVILGEVIDAGEKLLKASKEVLKYAEILLDTVRRFQEAIASGTEKPADKKTAVYYTKEDVRICLSEKTASGHSAEVKALLSKHGVKRLSELKAEQYEEVMNEAKEIGNE